MRLCEKAPSIFSSGKPSAYQPQVCLWKIFVRAFSQSFLTWIPAWACVFPHHTPNGPHDTGSTRLALQLCHRTRSLGGLLSRRFASRRQQSYKPPMAPASPRLACSEALYERGSTVLHKQGFAPSTGQGNSPAPRFYTGLNRFGHRKVRSPGCSLTKRFARLEIRSSGGLLTERSTHREVRPLGDPLSMRFSLRGPEPQEASLFPFFLAALKKTNNVRFEDISLKDNCPLGRLPKLKSAKVWYLTILCCPPPNLN